VATKNAITKPNPVDWRKNAQATDSDPDDELMETTPQDVVAVLGFDPKDLEDEEE
jgi:hypothetical protein